VLLQALETEPWVNFKPVVGLPPGRFSSYRNANVTAMAKMMMPMTIANRVEIL